MFFITKWTSFLLLGYFVLVPKKMCEIVFSFMDSTDFCTSVSVIFRFAPYGLCVAKSLVVRIQSMSMSMITIKMSRIICILAEEWLSA